MLVYEVNVGVAFVSPIAMGEGLRFAVLEGGRAGGAGEVTKIKV